MKVETSREPSPAPARWSRLSDHRKYLRDLDHEAVVPSSSSPEESADEDENDAALAGDSQSIVGFSIGRAQTILASPTTPAAERAAALNGTINEFLDTHDDENYDHDNLDESDPSRSTPKISIDTHNHHGHVSDETSPDRLPSPWRVTSSVFQSLDGATSSTVRHEPTDGSRRRKKSILTASEGLQRRLMPFKMPSIPHIQFPSMNSVNPFSRTPDGTATPTNDSTTSLHSSSLRPLAQEMSHRPSLAIPDRLSSLQEPESQWSPLRRSNSEGNFLLERAMSTASSLGDDSRWANVNGQINSRLRAIKDTWADSNFKMPRIKSFASLNFGAPWVEFPSHHHEDDHPRELQRPPYERSESHQSYATSILNNHEPFAIIQGGDLPAPRKMSKASAAQHPQFTQALNDLTGDVLILGGYRGSILRSAKAPYRQLWVPVKVGLNLRKANLELGLNPEDEENAVDHIFPSGMLKNIGPIDISKRLFKRLRASRHAVDGRLRVWDYGYDWRLSPHLLSKQLIKVLENLPCNGPDRLPGQRGAIVIAHSLGGLITRHAVNSRPDLFSGVIYAGVPQNCVNILGPLRNGDDVLLSSRVLTAQVNFTVRTTFALLPLDGRCFVDQDTKEPYPVDFFDIKSWEDYRFSPCIARPLPPSTMADQPGLVSNLVGSVASRLPNSRRSSFTKRRAGMRSPARPASPTNDSGYLPDPPGQAMDLQMNNRPNPQELGQNEEANVSTAVSIPKEAAVEYLTRILAEIKRFKQDLAFRPENKDHYPPTAILFGKSLPTVDGCKVKGRDGIKRADAYENLTFASGDGVVLAKAAQIPEGYRVVKGGVVSTDRGHISLLGDLEAVGRCLNAVIAGQRMRARKEEEDVASI